jgi:hypothetical protein
VVTGDVDRVRGVGGVESSAEIRRAGDQADGHEAVSGDIDGEVVAGVEVSEWPWDGQVRQLAQRSIGGQVGEVEAVLAELEQLVLGGSGAAGSGFMHRKHSPCFVGSWARSGETGAATVPRDARNPEGAPHDPATEAA